MSTESNDKKERLESLDEREKEVLKRIIDDTDFKVAEVAKSMLLGESTLRAVMTSIYKKLRVPNGERDKRGFIVREYGETYKRPEPEMHVDPPPRQVNQKLISKVMFYALVFSVVVFAIFIIAAILNQFVILR